VGTAARESDVVMPTDGRLPYTVACHWRRNVEEITESIVIGELTRQYGRPSPAGFGDRHAFPKFMLERQAFMDARCK
jgi:hypothetical protein